SAYPHGEKQQEKQTTENVLPATTLHRAPLAGLLGCGGACNTRRAISAESWGTVTSPSRRAAASSWATRSLAAATSAAALPRASFSTAARSSRSFLRAASCSA